MLALNNLRSLYESCGDGSVENINNYGFSLPTAAAPQPPSSSYSDSNTQQRNVSNSGGGFINWSNCLTDVAAAAAFGNVSDETNCLYLTTGNQGILNELISLTREFCSMHLN